MQTVTLGWPTRPRTRSAPVVNFAGAPDFSPTRIAPTGPPGFPLAAAPRAMAVPGSRPFIRIAGSNVVYNAPIVAIVNVAFNVTHNTNAGDRMLGIHIAGKSRTSPVRRVLGRPAVRQRIRRGQPIVYLSTDAGQPLTAVLERSTYVPALDKAAFNGGDGSARPASGSSGSSTGRPAPTTRKPKGSCTWSRRVAAADASAGNTAMIDARATAGTAQVFGDFPTLADPRHAQAYSPLWDAQLGPVDPQGGQRRAEHPPDRREPCSTWRPPGRTC